MRRTNPAGSTSSPPNTSDAPALSNTRLAIAVLALRDAVCGLVVLGFCPRQPRSPSTRSTAPAGPSPSRSRTLPPTGSAWIRFVTKYCKASRSRGPGTGNVAIHVPTRRNLTPRTAAIEDSSSITLRVAGANADEKTSLAGCSASRYSRINWIMPITFSVCCRAAETFACCCSATCSVERSSGSCSESSSEQSKPVSGWLNECSNSPSTSGPRGGLGNEC